MADTMLLSSAVRLPTPPPGASYSPGPSGSRKRSPPSRSPSPKRRRAPPPEDEDYRKVDDAEPGREMDERERQLRERFKSRETDETRRKPMTAEEKQAAAKAEYEKLLTMRSGGTYIPPARLRALQSQITDKTSKEYQRMAWEALKKSINGLINKVNVSNIKHIVPELFGENLVRGRGLFCRSIMKAQAASLPFTPIYAAMAAIVNTKLPQVGELLVNRLVVQFLKAFKRNDKAVCLSSTTFIAHLCNQQVAHETVAAQLLLLLLHKPTDDSVEIAVGLTREVGQHLEEMSPPIALAVFEQFRSILHEADIDKRVQYMIEVLFQVRKDRYKDNPAIREELDLVEEEDQITHQIDIDDDIDVQDSLNIFKYDPEWEEHEEAYRKLKAEILGEDSEGEGDDDESGSEESSDDEETEQERAMEIKDQTNTDLVNLRRTIYLTIMSSLDFEEACHKLMKVQLPPGQEPELPSMIIECCSQEKTYSKFFGLVGERFAKLNRLWTDLFEQSFAKYYDTIHRYETNRLRNIARFFGHLLSTDAIGWHVFSVVHLNEEETTSSSRIFIKILFQDLAEALGLPKLQERMKDDILHPSFAGIFPTDTPRNTRFSINYFTSIGMGVLTEEMREHLKNLPKPEPPALPAPRDDISDSASVSSYSSYSSYTTSRSYTRSPSRDRLTSRGRDARSRSPDDRDRGRSYGRKMSRSRSPPARKNGAQRSRSYSASISRSRSPPRRGLRRRSPSSSVSRSPPRRNAVPRRGRSPTRSRSSSYSSVSRSPSRRLPARRRDYSNSRSPSRSPPPRRSSPLRRRNYSPSRSRSPSSFTQRGGRAARDLSRSPLRSRPPRRRRPARYSRSRSWSRSYSPPSRRRAPAHRRRNSSSYSERSMSRSRSPHPVRRPGPRRDDDRRRSPSPVRRIWRRRGSNPENGGRRERKRGPDSPVANTGAGSSRPKAADFE
ncbi:pre-mRNA-splicing factor cwc22 [Rhinocladiella mackenziei CBS 650.93]|uniref:Pre-mRNA-splicing factor CWC22 n=1 Tax=Rhinocladiella mackenziei CBS 650.93 TaxID=1442369 RepID=A0A0D2IE79_9EURO|nr:pre-mRNA-splicing factor cwc22 [Rhinocladiella mackenziei CBS 650.93]KIX01541.1 pre-mRNA-splicing factor cwc22 [Rhinocladiella mackenziei CBS 650.93]